MTLKGVEPPSVATIKERAATNASSARRERLKELQLKLWPDWPDDRRGAPNTVVRSAVFGVVRRGRRQWVREVPVAGPQGWSITLSGWRLDQHDCDIWLEVMHLARNQAPGEPVRFTIHALLKRLGHGVLGKRDYAWIVQRLKHLTGVWGSTEQE